VFLFLSDAVCRPAYKNKRRYDDDDDDDEDDDDVGLPRDCRNIALDLTLNHNYNIYRLTLDHPLDNELTC